MGLTLIVSLVVAAVVIAAGLIGFAFPVWYGVGKPTKKTGSDNSDCDIQAYYYKGVDKAKSEQEGYYYPLYLSEADAVKADECQNGEGSAHAHNFENCETTFYMPNSSTYNHALSYLPKMHNYLEAQCEKPTVKYHFSKKI